MTIIGIVAWIAFVVLLFGVAAHLDRKLKARRTQLRPRAIQTPVVAERLDDGLFAKNKVTVDINNEIEASSVARVVQACDQVMRRRRKTVLEVRINSVGGDVTSALTITDLLKRTALQRTVRVIVIGSCMSAAVTILMAVPIERRYALPHSEFMVHASCVSHGGKRNKRTRAVDVQSAQQIAANSHVRLDDLTRLFKSGFDRFFSADEALKLGFISRII